jgi:type IV pilus assembly protein PilA
MVGGERYGREVQGMTGIFSRSNKNQQGFTLVELLIVIIVIAILCAIAIPTFLGQRERANDTAAYSLVRNGLTVLQTAFVDTGDYLEIDTDMLNSIDTTIEWIDNGEDLVSTSPPGITPAVGAEAKSHQLAVCLQSSEVADIATESASGNWFGLQVDTVNLGENGYVKVKQVDGSADLGW